MGVCRVSGQPVSLAETFKGLQAALEPLGVEVGSDVLAIWRDRDRAGREPLPATALRDLAEWTAKQLADKA